MLICRHAYCFTAALIFLSPRLRHYALFTLAIAELLLPVFRAIRLAYATLLIFAAAAALMLHCHMPLRFRAFFRYHVSPACLFSLSRYAFADFAAGFAAIADVSGFFMITSRFAPPLLPMLRDCHCYAIFSPRLMPCLPLRRCFILFSLRRYA